jgi:ABC-type polysaccharide/polyol phosphate export permease
VKGKRGGELMLDIIWQTINVAAAATIVFFVYKIIFRKKGERKIEAK